MISFRWRTALLSRVDLIQAPRGRWFSQTFGQAPPTDRLTTRSLRKTRPKATVNRRGDAANLIIVSRKNFARHSYSPVAAGSFPGLSSPPVNNCGNRISERAAGNGHP